MVIFGIGKKKPEEVKKLGKGYLPTERVKNLSDKGFSEPEIIDVLRKEGFSSEEIDRALTQALKIGVTGEEISERLPTLQELQQPQPLGFSQPEQSMQPQMPEQPIEYYPTEEYGTEELIESVVHERMGEVDQRLAEFRAKYSALERRLSDLHHQLSIVSKGRSESEQTIIAKIDSFKDSLDDINGRLSGLEKAFKEALPALIESVRSLTELAQRIKKEA